MFSALRLVESNYSRPKWTDLCSSWTWFINSSSDAWCLDWRIFEPPKLWQLFFWSSSSGSIVVSWSSIISMLPRVLWLCSWVSTSIVVCGGLNRRTFWEGVNWENGWVMEHSPDPSEKLRPKPYPEPDLNPRDSWSYLSPEPTSYLN